MTRVLYSINEVENKIKEGKTLLLAGDEGLLKQLSPGKWIAGTIPYFMGENGGVSTKEKICVTELPPYVIKTAVAVYNQDSISNIYKDASQNGFSFIIIPASSPIHLSFALNAPHYQGFATRPLIGWISGTQVSEIGKTIPKVFSGEKQKALENEAVVMHVTLPDNRYAEINILNIFEPGTGDTITFPEDSFSVQEALINGTKRNFAEYVAEKKLDIRLPLVANYSGAMINTSFQRSDTATRKVHFYAPVFKGVEYKHAKPIANYVAQFTSQMPQSAKDKILFSCNCILNYLFSELEGKQTGGITGPITFGEIAYQLLNQTMAYLTINNL